jgi:hypothetical protein
LLHKQFEAGRTRNKQTTYQVSALQLGVEGLKEGFLCVLCMHNGNVSLPDYMFNFPKLKTGMDEI